MRKFLAAVFLLVAVLASRANAQSVPVILQTSVPGYTTTFSKPLTLGSYVVVYTLEHSEVAITSIFSSAGNSYAQLSTSSANCGYVYSGFNAAGAVSESISASNVAGTDSNLVAVEVSGVNTSAPLASLGGCMSIDATPVTAPSVILTAPNSLVLIMGYSSGNQTVTFQNSFSNFTVNAPASLYKDFLFSGSEASVGTYAPQWTQASNLNERVFTVALASASTLAPLQITTTAIPNAVLGQAFSFQLQATGGRAPYTWGVTPNCLPAGLALSTSGIISGTPTQTGGPISCEFTVLDSE